MNPAQIGFKIDSHSIYDRMARGQPILWANLLRVISYYAWDRDGREGNELNDGVCRGSPLLGYVQHVTQLANKQTPLISSSMARFSSRQRRAGSATRFVASGRSGALAGRWQAFPDRSAPHGGSSGWFREHQPSRRDESVSPHGGDRGCSRCDENFLSAVFSLLICPTTAAGRR